MGLDFGKIGVLMGGVSCEREFSLKSGRAVYGAIKQSGINAVSMDIISDGIEENADLIKSQKIDCAFLALHGYFGEDGRMQQMLKNLGIPYTGSGVEASRMAMDKIASRKIFEANGLNVPRCKVVDQAGCERAKTDGMRFPLVVKPASGGSSIGLSVIDRTSALDQALNQAFKFDDYAIIEEFIEGREFTVGILGEKALPIAEIISEEEPFTYERKSSPKLTNLMVPANLDKSIAEKINSTALSAYRFLGCFAFSRVDIILNKDNLPFVLELNTIPGLTPLSPFPRAARAAGIKFTELCIKLIQLAYTRD